MNPLQNTPQPLTDERLVEIRRLHNEWLAASQPHWHNLPHLATTYAGELLSEVDRLTAALHAARAVAEDAFREAARLTEENAQIRRFLTPATTDDYSASIEDLVVRFASALNLKLQAARVKYGYHADAWLGDDWEAECRAGLLSHLAKGDPRDVAAYCAFMWHHGWSTPAPASPWIEVSELRADEHDRTLHVLTPDNQECMGIYFNASEAEYFDDHATPGWFGWNADEYERMEPQPTHYHPAPLAPVQEGGTAL